MEKLYSQQKQAQELTVSQIMNSLLPKWLSEEVLQIAKKRREAKGRRELDMTEPLNWKVKEKRKDIPIWCRISKNSKER